MLYNYPMTKRHTSSKIVLSVIVTFHQEGIIAHKTMLNIFDLLEPFKEQNLKFEIIIHVDNGDNDTISYLKRYEKDPSIRIFENSFGNPADSRNYCVKKSHGRYLALFDGDDIVSKKWLIDGYRMLEAAAPQELILHTECDITFGAHEDEPRAWLMTDSRSYDEDTIFMFTRNRWSAGTILPRETAQRFPYKKVRPGFGYEDWVFNMDTRHAGILHKVVPGSVKFYRIHDNSTYTSHGADNAITDYSDMFATERMQELAKYFQDGNLNTKSPNTISQRIARVTRSGAHATYMAITSLPGVGSLARRGLSCRSRRRGRHIFDRLPQPVQEAWLYANHIDNEIWPDPRRLSHLWYYDSEFNDQTERYCCLVSQINKDPDYIFLPPRLAVGGTEKVLVNYLNAFAELHPEWHIVVLAALPAQHPYSIPKNVDFVDFYSIIDGLSWTETDFLLSRFIIQTKARRLHVIHNELAFQWIKDHLSVLRNGDYRVYVSQFMHEFNQDARLKVGFIDPWIRDIYPAITKIFTDNKPIIEEMEESDGFASEKLVAHYQPVEQVSSALSPHINKPMRVLWASRIAPQKRPDLLRQIAGHLKSSEIQIDVYGRCQRPYNGNYFLGTTATYKGTYNGIASLDLSKYDAFLYTSQTDGLPNILLEIASAGIPIVASNVGGVGDIVSRETGYPVVMDDIAGYIDALKIIAADPATARVKARKAQQLVKRRHTWKHFVSQVKKDIQ